MHMQDAGLMEPHLGGSVGVGGGPSGAVNGASGWAPGATPDKAAMLSKVASVTQPLASGSTGDAVTTAGASTSPPPTSTTPAPTQIPYWGYYMGESAFNVDPSTTAPGQQFLAALQKYNPGASFVNTAGSDVSTPQWTLQGLDTSKIPGYTSAGIRQAGGLVDMNAGDYAPQNYDFQNWSSGDPWSQYVKNPMYGGNFRGQLYNPSAVGNAGAALGQVTFGNNVKPPDPSWIDTIGSMLPMLASFVNPLAGMMIGGIQSAGSAMSGGKFNFASLLPAVMGAAGLPSWMSGAAGAGLNIAQGGSPLAAILSMAGGASGIPLGSTLGNIIGNQIDPRKPRGG
ncbi:MAG: hypothetical protein KGI71_06525 [Patescibacteria group bacterium]|nr:hypothetical protein [Patescibacteria group bacterium]